MVVDGGFEIGVDLDPQEFTVASGMAKRKSQAIQEQKDKLQTIFQELSAACPFHLANPEDCPLIPLRRMEPRKRLQWLNSLSESDLAYLATYHRVCLTVKVRSKLALYYVKTQPHQAVIFPA
jgi:hypothetical protein